MQPRRTIGNASRTGVQRDGSSTTIATLAPGSPVLELLCPHGRIKCLSAVPRVIEQHAAEIRPDNLDLSAGRIVRGRQCQIESPVRSPRHGDQRLDRRSYPPRRRTRPDRAMIQSKFRVMAANAPLDDPRTAFQSRDSSVEFAPTSTVADFTSWECQTTHPVAGRPAGWRLVLDPCSPGTGILRDRRKGVVVDRQDKAGLEAA